VESTVFFVDRRQGRWTIRTEDGALAVARTRQEALALARKAARVLRQGGSDARVKLIDPEPRSFAQEAGESDLPD
jgi:hypothetical protein